MRLDDRLDLADDRRKVGQQVEAFADALPDRFPVPFAGDLAQGPVGFHEDGAGAVVGQKRAARRRLEIAAALRLTEADSRAHISGCSRRRRSTSAAAATVSADRQPDA